MAATIPLQKLDRRTPPAPAGQMDDTRTSTSTLIVAETSDMNWKVLTPAQAAKAIARGNTHLSPALVIVRSWTQKGRGGRCGWANRHDSYTIDSGRCLLERRSEYAYRVFVDLTAGGEMEIVPWSEYAEIVSRTAEAIETLKAWIAQRSELPSYDLAALMHEVVHSYTTQASVMREDMVILEALVASLPEQDGVGSLRDTARKARGM